MRFHLRLTIFVPFGDTRCWAIAIPIKSIGTGPGHAQARPGWPWHLVPTLRGIGKTAQNVSRLCREGGKFRAKLCGAMTFFPGLLAGHVEAARTLVPPNEQGNSELPSSQVISGKCLDPPAAALPSPNRVQLCAPNCR